MNDYKELVEQLRDLRKATIDGWTIGRLQVVMRMDCLAAADAIEYLVRQRDAAVKDMETIANNMLLGCEFCKKNCTEQANCLTGDSRFEWRGVQQKEGGNMEDHKYFVTVNNQTAAENMAIEDAMIFIKALFENYYNDSQMVIAIERMNENERL